MCSRFLCTSFIFVSIIFLSTSCTVGPDYEHPELNLPGRFGNKAEVQSNNREIQAEWWQHFDDETLNTLIDRAVINNRSVLQIMATVNQNRALANQAFSQLLPGAQLVGSYEKAKNSSARFPAGAVDEETVNQEVPGSFEYEVYTGSIDASWELDFFGRLRRELEGRNAEYTASVADLNDAIRILLSEVASSYMDLRAAQQELVIARRNEKLQSESFKLVKYRYDFGEVSALDLAQARAGLSQTRAIIPPLESATRIHVHRLAVLLGEQPLKLYQELLPPAAIPVYSGPVTIGEPEELLRSRPDVRRAERELAAATARIGVAVGDLFPKVTVSGSLGVEASTFSGLSDNADMYRFGPRITWAAFDTGLLRQRIQAAEAVSERALRRYEEAVLIALEDVENSLVTFTAEKEALIHLIDAKDASQKAYLDASLQYKEGIVDFLTVLDAQRTLLRTELEVARSNERVAQSIIGIYRAFGGGWQNWEIASVDS